VIRVLVVARSAAIRARLEAALARRADLLVTGAARWPTDNASEGEPDVVLLVEETGTISGFDSAPGARHASARLIVLGPEPVEDWASMALRQGARGTLPSDSSAAELGAAIEAVVAGLTVMPPAVADSGRPRTRRRVTAGPVGPLTPREIEILGLLAAGLGNKAIAARLYISGHTVKTHVVSLFEKLGVSTRAEAVAAGVRQGLLML
jgi:two-component system, NarL family, response regulator YdfI